MGGENVERRSTSHSHNSPSSSSSNYSSQSQRNEVEKHKLINGCSVDIVFDSVPNSTEVEYAIAAFLSFMQGLCSANSSDTLQPLWTYYYQRISESPGFIWIYDAFQLLQTVPSVQRMVTSISTDKAVWEAVLKNSEVQEFRRSIEQAEVNKPQASSNKELDSISTILRWIVDNMKLKVVELIELLKSLFDSSIVSPKKENDNPELKHRFEAIFGSTVLLSTVTLMIVLVNRIYGA